jgi:hypothetical protein
LPGGVYYKVTGHDNFSKYSIEALEIAKLFEILPLDGRRAILILAKGYG